MKMMQGRKQLTLLQGMWKKSMPGEYNNFRTFIFGITKQSMFPHGVVYEGVNEEPLSFRGESGANDSMVSNSLGQRHNIPPFASPLLIFDILTSWEVHVILKVCWWHV